MSERRLCFFSVSVLLFFLFSFLPLSVSASKSQETVSKIFEAEQLVTLAYEAVLDAEQVGGDVSDLLVKLNEAAELLSETHMAFESDFEGAIRVAELASEVAGEVRGEAGLLKVEASNAFAERSKLVIFDSCLGISVVLVASLLVYEVFKRRYFRYL